MYKVEPPIPIKEVEGRLERLFGPGYAVFAEWRVNAQFYEINTASTHSFGLRSFFMMEEDFKYTDEQLIDKFIRHVVRSFERGVKKEALNDA